MVPLPLPRPLCNGTRPTQTYMHTYTQGGAAASATGAQAGDGQPRRAARAAAIAAAAARAASLDDLDDDLDDPSGAHALLCDVYALLCGGGMHATCDDLDDDLDGPPDAHALLCNTSCGLGVGRSAQLLLQLGLLHRQCLSSTRKLACPKHHDALAALAHTP